MRWLLRYYALKFLNVGIYLSYWGIESFSRYYYKMQIASTVIGYTYDSGCILYLTKADEKYIVRSEYLKLSILPL